MSLSSSRELSKFELIPNEVLLETFEYLSPHDIFQAFYFLNDRYNQFLLSLQLRIDLIDVSKKNYDFHNYLLFSVVPHRIVSLRCEDLFDRLIYQIRLSQFIALKYLTITQLHMENLLTIMPKLNCLEELIYLNLQTRVTENQAEKIVFGGKLPALEKCVLDINQPILFDDNHSYPNLRDLTINQCTIEDLFTSIFPYTSQLQNLTVTLIGGIGPIDAVPNLQLQSLTIRTTTISFRRLTLAVFPFFPQIQRLSIEAANVDYTDGKQWSTVLSSHFSRLMNFYLYITFAGHDAPTANNRLELLNTFQTSYFRLQQWSFAIVYCPSTFSNILFSIPMVNKQISVNLYQTEIETTMAGANLFENIEQISLYLTNANGTATPSRFPNAESLQLISQYREHEAYPKRLFVDISQVVNFSKLKAIQLTGRHFPTAILILLDYTPNLYSLIIPYTCLVKMTKLLTDQAICRRLSTLIKHLTITSIDDGKHFVIFEKFPVVFPQLQSLSLSIQSPQDLHILMIFVLSKMAGILRSLVVSVEGICSHTFLDQFMIWLIDYMHTRDLDMVDVKLVEQRVCFCF